MLREARAQGEGSESSVAVPGATAYGVALFPYGATPEPAGPQRITHHRSLFAGQLNSRSLRRVSDRHDFVFQDLSPCGEAPTARHAAPANNLRPCHSLNPESFPVKLEAMRNMRLEPPRSAPVGCDSMVAVTTPTA